MAASLIVRYGTDDEGAVSLLPLDGSPGTELGSGAFEFVDVQRLARSTHASTGGRPSSSGRPPRHARRVATIEHMAHRVTLIPGDGIGPELAEATTRVLDATGIGFEWEPVEAGEATIATHGTPLPGQRPRVGHAQQGGAQGTDHDPGRRRVPERQRRRSARRSACTRTCGRRAR